MGSPAAGAACIAWVVVIVGDELGPGCGTGKKPNRQRDYSNSSQKDSGDANDTDKVSGRKLDMHSSLSLNAQLFCALAPASQENGTARRPDTSGVSTYLIAADRAIVTNRPAKSKRGVESRELKVES